MPLHKRPDGSPITAAPRLPLTADVARFVGDAVVLVVAETLHAARDAAELIEVEWEPLTAVVDMDSALAPDAPLVWPPADDLPAFISEFDQRSPSRSNTLGAKGVGEAGTCGAPPVPSAPRNRLHCASAPGRRSVGRLCARVPNR